MSRGRSRTPHPRPDDPYSPGHVTGFPAFGGRRSLAHPEYGRESFPGRGKHLAGGEDPRFCVPSCPPPGTSPGECRNCRPAWFPELPQEPDRGPCRKPFENELISSLSSLITWKIPVSDWGRRPDREGRGGARSLFLHLSWIWQDFFPYSGSRGPLFAPDGHFGHEPDQTLRPCRSPHRSYG